MTIPIIILVCILLALLSNTDDGHKIVTKSISATANLVGELLSQEAESKNDNKSSLSEKASEFAEKTINPSRNSAFNKSPEVQDFKNVLLTDAIDELISSRLRYKDSFFPKNKKISWKFQKGSTYSQSLSSSIEDATRWKILWRMSGDYVIKASAYEYESIQDMAKRTIDLFNYETGGGAVSYLCSDIGVIVITDESLNKDVCVSI